MTKKDEVVQHAKEKFGVTLDKKQKLDDLQAHVDKLESESKTVKKSPTKRILMILKSIKKMMF